MIANDTTLTIRKKFHRPDPALVEQLRGAATVHVIDALGGRGALDYRIKALDPDHAMFVGPALTCHAGASDNLAILAAFAIAEPGDVVIASTDSFTGTAVVGDLFVGMAINCQVAAIVTDGLARDLAGITARELPVFAAGVSPNSASRSGPGTVGLPIVIGPVTVSPGDVLVGDLDGVAVIPQDSLKEIIDRLDAIRSAEQAFTREVDGGRRLPEFMASILASPAVRYLS